MTLIYEMQLLDEIPMVLGSAIFTYCLAQVIPVFLGNRINFCFQDGKHDADPILAPQAEGGEQRAINRVPPRLLHCLSHCLPHHQAADIYGGTSEGSHERVMKRALAIINQPFHPGHVCDPRLRHGNNGRGRGVQAEEQSQFQTPRLRRYHVREHSLSIDCHRARRPVKVAQGQERDGYLISITPCVFVYLSSISISGRAFTSRPVPIVRVVGEYAYLLGFELKCYFLCVLDTCWDSFCGTWTTISAAI